jgi:trehalose 6-phosphate phosphatase
MIPLFSTKGLQRLEQIVKPGLLCAFDFDGTLAPIVLKPEEACLPADVQLRLLALSRHVPLAIISGRHVADIRERLGFEPDYLLGNHGQEGLPGWEEKAAEHEEMCIAWSEILLHALHTDARFERSIWLENKRYSLSLHYRLARDQWQTEAVLKELFSRLQPAPRVIAGKYTFSLVPQDAADKGAALAQLISISGASGAVYVGDDVTDEDVFRSQRADVMSVRIEYDADSAADYFLEEPSQIVQFLDELCKRLSALRGEGIA